MGFACFICRKGEEFSFEVNQVFQEKKKIKK